MDKSNGPVGDVSAWSAVERLGFVALAVSDLDAAVDYFETIGGLRQTERRKDEVFLSGGTEHHWIRLVRSPKRGLVRIGYQLAEAVELDPLKAQIGASGGKVLAGGTLADDRVDGTLRFRDPDGIEIELYREQLILPLPVTPGRFKVSAPLHAVCLVSDPKATAAFYSKTLGLRVSDWIERTAVFMRCKNGFHHSFGAFESESRAGALDHLCVLVPKVDDVILARNFAAAAGIKRRQDLVRHAASGSISTYIHNEYADSWLEFCTEHEMITEDRRVRTLARSATTGDLWDVESRLSHLSEEGALAVDALWKR